MRNVSVICILLLSIVLNGQENERKTSLPVIIDFSKTLGLASGENYIKDAVGFSSGGELSFKGNAHDYLNVGIDIRWNRFGVEDTQFTGSIDKIRLFGIGITAGHIYPITPNLYANGDLFFGAGRLNEQGSRSHAYFGGKAGFKYRLYKHFFVNLSYSYSFYSLRLNSAPEEKVGFFNSTSIHTIGLGLSIN